MNGLNSTPAQRWLARLSFVLAGLAIVILLVFAGLKSLAMVAVGLAAAVVGLAAAYFVLSRRGIWRWLSLAVFVLAPIAVIAVYAFRDLLWIAVLSAAVWLLAGMTARLALAGSQADWRMPEHPAQPPARHPYLIMNPKSGGGKVGKFDLKRKAEDLGAEVFLIGGPEPVDVAELAREAVGGRRRSARRRRGRRNAGPGGRDRGRARHPVHGHQRGHAQPLRPRPRAGPRGPGRLPGRFVRRRRVAGRPRDDQRPDVRQQRVVRRVRGGRRDPGLPRRQAEHDPEYAS